MGPSLIEPFLTLSLPQIKSARTDGRLSRTDLSREAADSQFSSGFEQQNLHVMRWRAGTANYRSPPGSFSKQPDK